MLRLNNIKLFLLGLGVIVTCYFLRQLTYILESERTEGKVVGTRITQGAIGGITTSPIVSFRAEGHEFTFYAETNLEYAKDDTVPVIYKKSDPEDANIYTFFGFWFQNIAWFLIPLVVWTAFSFSYLGKGEYLTLNIRYPFVGKSPLKDNDKEPDDWPDKLRLE